MSIETALTVLGIFAFPAGIGLLSGFSHCAAMCGPIHLFLARESGRGLWLYHTGRIVTYTLLGAAAGALSHSITPPSFRWVWVALYLVLGLRLVGVPLWPKSWGVRYGGWLMRRIRPLTRSAAEGHTSVLFVLGMAAGILPCATTQAGLAWAAGSANPGTGAIGMAVLGIGTLPLFLALPSRLFPKGQWFHDVLGVALILLAGWKVYTMAFTPTHSCH